MRLLMQCSEPVAAASLIMKPRIACGKLLLFLSTELQPVLLIPEVEKIFQRSLTCRSSDNFNEGGEFRVLGAGEGAAFADSRSLAEQLP